jgi:hypothetical protein
MKRSKKIDMHEKKTDAPAKARAAQCVASFLTSKEVPTRKHSRTVEAILGISYSQAHRMVLGTDDWTLDELMKVASAFGSTLDDVLQPLLARRGQPGSAPPPGVPRKKS